MNLENNVLKCSCQESHFEGVPCRHELCVFIKGSRTISNLNVHKRWTKNYFALSSLPNFQEELQDEEEEEKENDKEEEKEHEESKNQHENRENENIKAIVSSINQEKPRENLTPKITIVSYLMNQLTFLI